MSSKKSIYRKGFTQNDVEDLMCTYIFLLAPLTRLHVRFIVIV